MSDGAVLAGKRIAMLVEDEFEDRELTGPLEMLRAAGATVTIVGPTAGARFTGKRGTAVVTSDLAAGAARMEDFDALVIPGGHAPDKMRMRHAMVDLARDAMDANKPVARDLPRAVAADLRQLAARDARSPAGRRSPSTSRTPAAATSTSRSSKTAT